MIPRAEMLAELMRLKYSVAIAGAHEAYDEQVAVIAIPTDCPLVQTTTRLVKS